MKFKFIGILVAALCLVPSVSGARTINGDLLVQGDLNGGLVAAGQMINLNLDVETTTNTNDTIKIECGGAACSASNPGFVAVNSAVNPGQTTVFRVTSDVSILLTGAHWQIGGTGNIADAILRVNAVDNNGSLGWCLSYLGYVGDNISNTLDSTTPSNVNLNEELLCNIDITSSTNTITEVAWFRADFNDTGDIWAVQTDTSSLHNNERADGNYQDWNPTFTGFSSDPTYTDAKFTQIGARVCLIAIRSGVGTSNATSFTMTLPIDAKHQVRTPIADVVNNGSTVPNGGSVQTTASSNVLNVYASMAAGSWTASGGKTASINICYIPTNSNP